MGISLAGPLEQRRLDRLTPDRSCGRQRRLSPGPIERGDPSGERPQTARTGVRRCDRPAEGDARGLAAVVGLGSVSRPRLRVSHKAAVFVHRQFRLRREIPEAVGCDCKATPAR